MMMKRARAIGIAALMASAGFQAAPALAYGSNGGFGGRNSVNAMVFSNAKDPAVFTAVTEKLKEDMKFPSNIVAGENGLLYITDQNGGDIIVVRQDGTIKRLFSMGWNEGTLRYPAQLCLDSGGDLFVADRENSRIQEFMPLK